MTTWQCCWGEAQVRGDERGPFSVPLVHQGEEEADLDGLDLHVADLNVEAIEGEVPLDHLVFRVLSARVRNPAPRGVPEAAASLPAAGAA